MKPSDEPRYGTIQDSDQLFGDRGGIAANWLFSALKSAILLAIPNASSESSGHLSSADKIKLDDLQTSDEIDAIGLSARTEHVGWSMDVPSNGTFAFFVPLINSGTLKEIYLFTSAGSVDIQVKINNVVVNVGGAVGANPFTVSTTPVTYSPEAVFDKYHKCEITLTNTSTSPACSKLFFIGKVEFDA